MRLDDETYETFVRAAQAEHRSLANLVETAALQHIQASRFVDDVEMARPVRFHLESLRRADSRQTAPRWEGPSESGSSQAAGLRGIAVLA